MTLEEAREVVAQPRLWVRRPPWWRPLARRKWDRFHAALLALKRHEWDGLLRVIYPPELVAAQALRSAPSFQKLTRTKEQA